MSKKSAFVTGSLLIIAAAILWGLDGVVLTPRLFNLDVSFIVFILHALPFIAFIIPFGIVGKRFQKSLTFSAGDWILFVAIGATGGVTGTLAIVKALMVIHFAPLSIVVLLQKLQPVFAIILAIFLLKERPGKRFFVLASLALIASYFMTFGFKLPNIQQDKTVIEAAIYALIASAAFGSATTLGKKALLKFDSNTVMFFRYGIATAIMIVIVLVNGKIFTQFAAATPMNWLIFFITAATTGSGAIFIYYIGLKKVSASVSTICELFFPISTVVFDIIINKAKFSVEQIISALFLAFFVLMISLFPKQQKELQ